MCRLLVRGARQIVQVVDDGRKFLKGPQEMKSLAVMEESEDKNGLSIVIDE